MQIYPNSDGGFFWEFKNTHVIDYLRFKKKLATDKWFSFWYKLSPKRFFERKKLKTGKALLLELAKKLEEGSTLMKAFEELNAGQSKTVQKIIYEATCELEETSSIKNTLEKYPTYFPKFHNHLIFGGEGARDLITSIKSYAKAIGSSELQPNVVL